MHHLPANFLNQEKKKNNYNFFNFNVGCGTKFWFVHNKRRHQPVGHSGTARIHDLFGACVSILKVKLRLSVLFQFPLSSFVCLILSCTINSYCLSSVAYAQQFWKWHMRRVKIFAYHFGFSGKCRYKIIVDITNYSWRKWCKQPKYVHIGFHEFQ